MQVIPLTHGKLAIIDDEDFEAVSKVPWCLSLQGYAVTRDGNTTMKMHHFIMGKREGLEIDHINNDKIDNRRSNLRHVTHAQNCQNSAMRNDNTSGFRGVTYQMGRSAWKAQIYKDKKNHHLGLFPTKQEAALAYNKAAARLFGEFAKLNIIK